MGADVRQTAAGWFSAVFDFYPVLVDYSGIMSEMNGGGGTFGLPELKPDEGVKATYYHAFTADELDAIVRGNGCTVLYIQKLDDIFVQSYSDLFTDKLAAAQAGETVRPFFQYFARLLGRAVRPIILPYRNGAADDAVRRRRAAFLTYLLEEKENG